MEENLFSFLSICEKNVTCKRDPEARDRDETFDFQSETRPRRSHISARPRRSQNASRDRDVETETTSLPHGLAVFDTR